MVGHTRYHIGIRSEHEKTGAPHPLQYVILGGITFHRFTEKVTGEGADTRRDRFAGSYVSLTQNQIERIERDLDRYRVQWRGKDAETGRPARARLVDRTMIGYAPQPGEERLDGWIYMVPSDGPAPHEDYDPPSVASTREREVVVANPHGDGARAGGRSRKGR